MEGLYHDTNLKLEEIKTYLSTYERCSKTHEPQLVKEIDEKLAVVNANCQKLEAKVDHEPPARRLVGLRIHYSILLFFKIGDRLNSLNVTKYQSGILIDAPF